jgi:hypothetical protein
MSSVSLPSDLSNPDAMQGSSGGKSSGAQMDWWETSTAMKKEYEEQIKARLPISTGSRFSS